MKRSLVSVVFLMVIYISGCGLLVDEGRKIVAKVGREPIRLDELLARIRSLPFEERAKTNDPDQAIRLQARRSLLESMITEELLIQEAKARNIPVSDEEALAVLKAREEAEEPENTALTEGMGGSSAHEHKHEEAHSKQEINAVRTQLMVQKMINSELNETNRKKFYDEHPQDFSVSPPQVIFELLVTQKSQENLVKKIRQKAASDSLSLTQALASLKDASEVSFCGELPPAPSDKLNPIIKKNLDNLSVGQLSEPFDFSTETSSQIALLRLVGNIDAIPYEQARESINKKLYDNFMAELRKKHEVVYYQDRLDYRLDG